MTGGKFVRNCILLLLICIVAGGGVITAANYLPVNSKIKDASMEQIQSDGQFPEIPSMDGGYGGFTSMNPTVLELATDSLMLKMAFYEGEGAGLEQAFRCYSTQYEEEYSRYWHGYVAVLRPLLMLFDYHELRILNGICQTLILLAAVHYVWKLKGIKYALALVSSYILLMPIALAYCLQYSWAFYTSFGSLFVYLRWRSFWNKGNRYVYFFILTGAVTTYLDLLTYPLLSWGLNAVWFILLRDADGASGETMSGGKAVRGYVRRVVTSGIAWIVGYSGMWAGKWALGSIVLRENLFEKAYSEALLWTVNDGAQSITMNERLYSLYKNWGVYDYKIYVFLLAAWFLYWLLRGAYCGWDKSVRTPALLLTACSSVVWYMALSGHSSLHHIFTHRTFGVSIAAFMAMVLVSTEKKAVRERKASAVAIRATTLAGAGILSFGMAGLLKDEYRILNGGYSAFATVKIEDAVFMDFTPAYSEIREIGLGISVENGAEGYYRVRLMDGDRVLDESKLQIRECTVGNWHELAVDWKLAAGHTYRLCVEPVENNGTVYLWVTADGGLPMPEFGKASMGTGLSEQALSGQMLTGLTYWCIPQSKFILAFFIVSFVGAWMMVVCGGRGIADVWRDRRRAPLVQEEK